MGPNYVADGPCSRLHTGDWLLTVSINTASIFVRFSVLVFLPHHYHDYVTAHAERGFLSIMIMISHRHNQLKKHTLMQRQTAVTAYF